MANGSAMVVILLVVAVAIALTNAFDCDELTLKGSIWPENGLDPHNPWCRLSAYGHCDKELMSRNARIDCTHGWPFDGMRKLGLLECPGEVGIPAFDFTLRQIKRNGTHCRFDISASTKCGAARGDSYVAGGLYECGKLGVLGPS